MPAVPSMTCQTGAGREAAASAYRRVRGATEALCVPLETDDYGLQSMPDVSPVKWHIAHVSWFFETFVLLPHARGYQVFDAAFDHLFNSYYLTHGDPFMRPQRGLLSRPTVSRVFAYRQAVDEAVLTLIEQAGEADWAVIEGLLTLGLNHEQQHQELILTDIQHAFAVNPLRPAYRTDLAAPRTGEVGAAAWLTFDAGLREIGAGDDGFAYDNERPRHRVWVEAFALADRPVTNAEYLEFIEDGGYSEPRWWLSDGWARVHSGRWQAPLYWTSEQGSWESFTLGGMRPLDRHAPVAHVSYYEADAYARWRGSRLPTEAEWEIAARADAGNPATPANLRDADRLTPTRAAASDGLRQLFGDVWEWTASAYSAYPGFRAPAGPVGEYNGKFMSGQMVLRGGSCVTPADHVRASYRNFFYPGDRWQFSGIRLAEDR